MSLDEILKGRRGPSIERLFTEVQVSRFRVFIDLTNLRGGDDPQYQYRMRIKDLIKLRTWLEKSHEDIFIIHRPEFAWVFQQTLENQNTERHRDEVEELGYSSEDNSQAYDGHYYDEDVYYLSHYMRMWDILTFEGGPETYQEQLWKTIQDKGLYSVNGFSKERPEHWVYIKPNTVREVSNLLPMNFEDFLPDLEKLGPNTLCRANCSFLKQVYMYGGNSCQFDTPTETYPEFPSRNYGDTWQLLLDFIYDRNDAEGFYGISPIDEISCVDFFAAMSSLKKINSNDRLSVHKHDQLDGIFHKLYYLPQKDDFIKLFSLALHMLDSSLAEEDFRKEITGDWRRFRKNLEFYTEYVHQNGSDNDISLFEHLLTIREITVSGTEYSTRFLSTKSSKRISDS